MTRLARVSGRQLIAALRKAGFDVLRVKGSHPFLSHPDGRPTVVPVHRGETIGPGLMSKILHDCDMTSDELSELLYLGHKISAGKAAELLDMRKREFIRLLARKGIPYFDYSDEELEDEFRAVDEWKGHGRPA